MHLVWDWNGTLLNDFDLTIAATNAMLASYGARPVTREEHRRLFRRPIVDYYAEILARPIGPAEFATLDRLFHAEYDKGLAQCALVAGAVEAMTEWAATGTQSLLSMWFHDQLVPMVTRLGLAGHFTRIDGLRTGVGGGGKTEHLVRHLDALGMAGADCVVIGDTLDDADAAAAVGARCVLVSGGFTDTDRLAATGLPVASSPREAIRLAAG